MPECEIFEDPMPDQSDLLTDSSHVAVIGALRPMSGTRNLRKDQRYPSSTEKNENSWRYQNEFRPHRCINSLAWYSLREMKGKKILSDSTLNPLASYLYLHKDVALVTMSHGTLQQRAAFVLTLNELVEQVTPKVVMPIVVTSSFCRVASCVNSYTVSAKYGLKGRQIATILVSLTP